MGLKIYKNYQCAPLAPTKTAQLYDITAIKNRMFYFLTKQCVKILKRHSHSAGLFDLFITLLYSQTID